MTSQQQVNNEAKKRYMVLVYEIQEASENIIFPLVTANH